MLWRLCTKNQLGLSLIPAVSPVQVVDYVGVLVFPHHQDLVDDQLLLGLLLQVHLFNGDL